MDQTGCRRVVLLLAVLALALAGGSQVARAQTTDVYTVDYYSNANTGCTSFPPCIGSTAPDATVRVINPGTTSNGTSAAADLCALIYVFDANQQLSECCGCSISANGLLTLSVNSNLVGNPLLGSALHTGVIKIVSSVNATPCDPTKITPTETLRAWATHIQHNSTFLMTEGESQAATLGTGEQADLGEDCTVLEELGSGHGVCSCPPCIPGHGPKCP